MSGKGGNEIADAGQLAFGGKLAILVGAARRGKACGGCVECLLAFEGDIPPVGQADAAEVLGLEAEAAAVHLGGIGSN